MKRILFFPLINFDLFLGIVKRPQLYEHYRKWRHEIESIFHGTYASALFFSFGVALVLALMPIISSLHGEYNPGHWSIFADKFMLVSA